jgi:UDP:flavonoid glycosyltransferase YjiC (YdhE family)
VQVLTGSRFSGAVATARAEHVALPHAADYDDRDVTAAFPGRPNRGGVAQLRFDIDHVFLNPIPHQLAAVDEILDRFAPDAVITDAAFLGAVPLAMRPRAERPPVIVCGVIPLTLSSRDTAPFGLGLPPSSSPLGRVRNRVLNLATQRLVFAGNQGHFQDVMQDLGAGRVSMFLLDAPVRLADRFLQLTAPGFEYPRSDLPAGVTFAGPLLSSGTVAATLPPWWADLEGRTVIHVTQGTIANDDLERLIGATVRALADDDVIVVATTGGRPTSALSGPLPPNARVAEFIPYEQLLPRVDAMVTNGGYGGIHYAIAHGVPLVVGGATEDKREIAARVRWSGVGVDLRTERPEPRAIHTAVHTVLREPEYRRRVGKLQAEFATHRPLDLLADVLADEVRPEQARATRGSTQTRNVPPGT